MSEDRKPGLFQSIVTNRCPHCRKGKLFSDPNPYHLKSAMKMPDQCAVCGQPYELQTGFYYGTGYVSYALSTVFILLSFVIWFFTIGFSLSDDRIFWWLGTVSVLLIVLQPVIQRLCRSIWIAMFVRYDSNLKSAVKQ